MKAKKHSRYIPYYLTHCIGWWRIPPDGRAIIEHLVRCAHQPGGQGALQAACRAYDPEGCFLWQRLYENKIMDETPKRTDPPKWRRHKEL